MTALAQSSVDLLCCPLCGADLSFSLSPHEELHCSGCTSRFPVRDNLISLTPEAVIGSQAQQKNIKIEVRGKTHLIFDLPPVGYALVGKVPTLSLINRTHSLKLSEMQWRMVQRFLSKTSAPSLSSWTRQPDILFHDSEVDPVHAVIFSDGFQVTIADLMSQKGVWQDNTEHESCVLTPDKAVVLGKTQLFLA